MASMGRRRFIFEYSQTPGVHFFLCRRCRASIALNEELFHRDTEFQQGIFEAIVNVKVEGPENYLREGIFTIARVLCNVCDSHLGWKVIEVDYPVFILIPGRSMLYLHMLLKWDGTRMVYADTNEPVGNA